VGVCAGDGPCPAGRRHTCRICGDSHRASHFHQKEKSKGKGKSNKDKKKEHHRDRRGEDGAQAGR